MQGPAAPQSWLHFYYDSCGLLFSLLLPLFGLLGFALTVALVVRGRGATLGPTLVFAVLLPVFIGLYGTIDGFVSTFRVLAASVSTPKPAEVAMGIQMSLVTLWLGMFLAIPSYVVAAGGTVARSVWHAQRPSSVARAP